jgi:hypothetical protein
MFSELSVDIKNKINKYNKTSYDSKTNCRFRNSMFDFIVDISKDLGFTETSCKNYWNSNVIHKIIEDNHNEIIEESKSIYDTCKKNNSKLDTFLLNTLFSFGIPNELILYFIQHFSKILIKNHFKYKIDLVATSIMFLENNLYLSFSTIKAYKNILYNLMELNNDENIKFIINEYDMDTISDPPILTQKPKKYDFPDYIIIGTFEYKKIKGHIYLIFNIEYRHNKYIFRKNTEKKNMKLNFMPFKKYENNTVSCIHGSTCSEPVLINWLRKNNILQGDYKQIMGTFFLKSASNYTYSNQFLVGTKTNIDNYSSKLFERVVLGFFYNHLQTSIPNKKNLISFLSAHLNIIRKLMIPCPGCLMNNELIKKNMIGSPSWNALDCDSKCTMYELQS